MGKLTILIADDHEIVREGIRSILQPCSEWEIVGEATNGRLAVEKSAELRPAVAVLDLAMPEMDGLDATRRIREVVPETEVVILTVDDSGQKLREALACGARAYVLKSEAGRDLVAAIESASMHRRFLSLGIARRNEEEGPVARRGPLTRRETEVLELLGSGLTNRQIAKQLHVSVKTAETHRTNLMRKIGAHSLADVVRYGIRSGLIQA